MAQINKPSLYFNTKLYTGDGTDGRGITGVGFQPDWCWFKARSTAYENQVYDVVRGATKRLVTNDNTAEGTQTNGLQSFDSDGFTVGNANGTNVNAVTYASWNWLAGGTGVSNTDGSITSTVSANTTSGFSIVSFTGNATAGATIGHGLGAVPSVILTKNRDFAYNWHLWTHAFSSFNDTIQLNTSAAIDTGTLLNNTAPTSSVITLGSSSVLNASGEKIIAYVFAEKKGFSKFGSYTGNGSTDGTFVYTGFKPSFVIIKRTDSTSDWVLLDNKRDSFNLMNKKLFSSNSDSEYSGQNACDFLSNGFKLRDNATNAFATNISGATYIYLAFAESPLVGTNNIPATAR